MNFDPMSGIQRRYNPLAELSMLPGYGGGGGSGDFNPILAQILRTLEKVNADSEARMAAKSKTFDPGTYYRTGGAPPPYFTGLSASQRFRDMQMRQAAQMEAAKAAVAAKQREQAAAIQPGTAADLATSNITRPDGPMPYEVLIGPHGTGNAAPVAVPAFSGTNGLDIREFFQRAVNSEAGSPNAAALGLAPQPGYRGVPMGAADELGWASAWSRAPHPRF